MTYKNDYIEEEYCEECGDSLNGKKVYRLDNDDCVCNIKCFNKYARRYISIKRVYIRKVNHVELPF